MDYSGPDAADFRDVNALNLAWLVALRSFREWPDGWDGELGERMRTLDDAGAARLASVPFLLFSLREHDDAFWSQLLREERSGDLFTARDARGHGLYRLMTAALAFLWRLCRQNPHTARLVSGAPPQWCETIAACSLVELLDSIVRYPGAPQPRLAEERLLWSRLLDAGCGPHEQQRRAAHLAALQAILTRQAAPEAPRLAAAACRVAPVAVARSGDRKR